MTGPQVSTRHGVVRGAVHDGISVFKGMRYAAPTSGANRFAPPAPPESWDGVRDAFDVAPCAPQNPSMLEQMLGAGEQEVSEDCLGVNVFTPGCDDAARPVMVWIHGGGFETGNGGIAWYDGTNLAHRDVVVVTLNYRLGVFGFLHLDDIGPGFEGSGNVGLLDQIAALEWVRDNIAAFGGDPGQVTVFGESAGAFSIGTLLAMPAAAGLFHRAILQSGSGSQVHGAEAATDIARKFLAEAGVAPGDLGRLRELPMQDLLAAQQRLSQSLTIDDGLPLTPVVDGRLLADWPTDVVRAGSAAGVDVLIGTTAEEMKLFLLMDPTMGSLDDGALSQRTDRMFVPAGREPGQAVAEYRDGRPHADRGELLTAVLTDYVFRIPAIRLAEAQLANHDGVWMYEFAYASPAFGGALGSCHAIDIPFVWDNLAAEGAAMFAGSITPESAELARRTADAWVAFARTGVPAADGLPRWPAYDTERRATMRLDAGHVELIDDPNGNERRLWDGIDPRLST